MRRRVIGVLAGATALLAAIPAVASASTGACTVSTTTGSPLFAAYGDPGDYILAPGGTFGSGAAGWSLTATDSVKLEFTTASGTAQVDDIYFDPYGRS